MVAQVGFPIAIPGIYDYTIPEHLQGLISAGVAVKVMIRSRILWGVVVGITQHSQRESLREIIEVKKEYTTQSSASLLELYRWVASYYHCELSRVFRPVLRRKALECAAKQVTVYTFSGNISTSLTKVQREFSEKLETVVVPVTAKYLKDTFHLNQRMIKTLVMAGVLRESSKQVMREAQDMFFSEGTVGEDLSEQQRQVVDFIWTHASRQLKPFLLFGITGSGKTHVYIHLAKRVLAQGKGVMILVPEIALTPQTIWRFKQALGKPIAVIHSGMSDGERRDSVEQIICGNRPIVIGVRSAIFLPMPACGLIVVDEEHDQSYKQSEMEPRYHARDVAVMRGMFQQCMVVLGSATPSLESYYNASIGKYILVEMNARFGFGFLPKVVIVDMNKEREQNNWTFLSEYLKEKISETLEQKRQIILLINRRGFAITLLCTTCGRAQSCPHCSVNLVYHSQGSVVKCHQCGFEQENQEFCPSCGGRQIKYKGTGIQKVEEEMRTLFSQARILRMDQDSTRKKGSHVHIIEQFLHGEADILIGTQMVAKGLNFPGVTLVGVLQADIGLHIPDFRAAERTFQLLTQVAGRAGRHDNNGHVVIQTYYPQEHGIVAAQTHDVRFFFEKEIGDRKALGYPPFSRIARIVVSGEIEHDVDIYSKSLASLLHQNKSSDILILGPSPAVIAKLRNIYRYAILIKAFSTKSLHALLSVTVTEIKKQKSTSGVSIDVDPVSLL